MHWRPWSAIEYDNDDGDDTVTFSGVLAELKKQASPVRDKVADLFAQLDEFIALAARPLDPAVRRKALALGKRINSPLYGQDEDLSNCFLDVLLRLRAVEDKGQHPNCAEAEAARARPPRPPTRAKELEAQEQAFRHAQSDVAQAVRPGRYSVLSKVEPWTDE